jgi:hypothetical protein
MTTRVAFAMPEVVSNILSCTADEDEEAADSAAAAAQVPEYRDFRRSLYKQMSSWASSGGGPQYRIDGIFMWSVGTWDVLGVAPGSAGGGSFADPVIADYIRKGNAIANQGHHPGTPTAAHGGKVAQEGATKRGRR